MQNYLTNFYGSSLSFYLLNKFLKSKEQTFVFIAKNAKEVSQVYEDILSINPNLASRVYIFLEYQSLIYEEINQSEYFIKQRVDLLRRLQKKEKIILITTSFALLTKLSPLDFADEFYLKVNASFNLDSFKNKLRQLNFTSVSSVLNPGEFAIKGEIIDLFLAEYKNPIRITLDFDKIEKLHFFSKENQTNINEIEKISIKRYKEIEINEKTISCFRQNYRNYFQKISTEDESIYNQVSRGQTPDAIENYLPLFFEKTKSIFSFLDANTKIFVNTNYKQDIDEFYETANDRFLQYQGNILRPNLKPEDLHFTKEEFIKFINPFYICNFTGQKQQISSDQNSKSLKKSNLKNSNAQNTQKQKDEIYSKLDDFSLQDPISYLKEKITQEINIFIFYKDYSLDSFLYLLKKNQINFYQENINNINLLEKNVFKKQVCLVDASCLINFFDKKNQTIYINVFDLLKKPKLKIQTNKESQNSLNPGNFIKDLAMIKIDQFLVHLNHGIGIYRGLETHKITNQTTELIKLEFAQNGKLYLPINQINMLSCYMGSDNPKLSNLNSTNWQKTLNKTKKSLEDIAADILKAHALRKKKQGISFKKTSDYDDFCADFEFEETQDQLKAILDVEQDMQSSKKMDRLICGDVGFGKTEVAMRAAFLAASCGYQVAILVPTTLLAKQHFDSFIKRFKNYAINIALLSRFVSSKKAKEIKNDLEQGKVDIIIGTHALLNKSIKYKNLGLLVIDEEHRFGVKQKETIKTISASVDLLFMSATPIPRTLNMALGKLQDLSLIAMAPKNRIAVKTFVANFSNNLIKDAITRETNRGGQIFFLHNDVATIDAMKNKIQALFPKLKIALGHAKMNQNDLESIMLDFYRQKYQVLVCTSIIETGIDIPNANTIIINNAINFGLSQLHQLRGRVGRSSKQAFAYLLIGSREKLAKTAKKRLDAIQKLNKLGAGFLLASFDLEIRGAGELLGKEQSGNIHGIGFSLYMELLNQAVEKLNKNPIQEQKNINLDLKIDNIFTSDYIFDPSLRINFYKRINMTNNLGELLTLRKEIVERFGKLNQAGENLFVLSKIRIQCSFLNIKSFMYKQKKIYIRFTKNTRLSHEFILELASDKLRYSFTKDQELKIKLQEKEKQDIVNTSFSLLDFLNKKITQGKDEKSD